MAKKTGGWGLGDLDAPADSGMWKPGEKEAQAKRIKERRKAKEKLARQKAQARTAQKPPKQKRKPPFSQATVNKNAAKWKQMVAESKKKDEALLSKGQPLPTGNIHERLGRGRTPQPQAVGGGGGGQLTYEQQVNQRAMQIVQESIQAAGQRPEDTGKPL